MNHLSSNMIRAVLNFSGMLSDGGNLHCWSDAILAPSSSPLRSSTTVEYGVPLNKSLGRQKMYKRRRAAVKPPAILLNIFSFPAISYFETVAVPDAVLALTLESYMASHLTGGRMNCPA